MAEAGARPGLDVRLKQSTPIALDVQLDCRPAELLALVGPSGSGKSTVLRCIAGLMSPAQARVVCGAETWLDSERGIRWPARQRRVGMVFQSYGLFPHLSALHNVLEAVPRDAADRPARARRLLERVHLQGLEHRLPQQLSGGQQQRVAVARALAREPAVLLLDEPFSAVDKVTREKLHGELAELRAHLDMPVVLVTHDLEEAAMLADRMAILSRGRILQTGAPLDVLHRPHSVEVARLLGLKNIYSARIVRHDESARVSWLDWEGCALRAPLAAAYPVGSTVAWAIPNDAVLLVPPGRHANDEGDTRFEARIEKITTLGDVLRVRVLPFGRAGLPMAMTVPRHLAARHALTEGVMLPLRLRGDAIQVMPEDRAST
jgi:molybdate transport system ATP-binding protein